jgi:hypothetical protein
LDGALPGDAGFDPFSLANKETLWYMKEAEIKHSRFAMLAVVGWPLAELYDQPIAQLIRRPALLTKSGESPSLFNGGLDKFDIENWVLVIALAGLAEAVSNTKENKARIAQNYAVGEQVLFILDAEARRSQPKMGKPTRGPFDITAVHNNSAVTITRGGFTETINIRRIKPFNI